MEENSEREENLSKKIENLHRKFSIFFDKFSEENSVRIFYFLNLENSFRIFFHFLWFFPTRHNF